MKNDYCHIKTYKHRHLEETTVEVIYFLHFLPISGNSPKNGCKTFADEIR